MDREREDVMVGMASKSGSRNLLMPSDDDFLCFTLRPVDDGTMATDSRSQQRARAKPIAPCATQRATHWKFPSVPQKKKLRDVFF